MRYRVSFAALLLGGLLSGFLATANLQSVSAQTATVPDMSKFGYPQVVATANFTPGTAATVTAGNQKVVLPADFLSKPVKFELLEGTADTFKPVLTGDDSDSTIVATFAFRVTDPATSQLVGTFDKPVQWSITDPAITANSAVYNTTGTSPIKVTKNPTAGTLTGTTLAHGFGGAGVGWLVLNSTETTSAPAPVPTSAPTSLPATGQGGSATDNSNLLLALLAGLSVIAIGGGLFLRQYSKHR